MKTNILNIIAASAMLMFCGCASDIEVADPIDETAETDSSDSAVITFTINNSSSRSAVARDDDSSSTDSTDDSDTTSSEVQTDNEKKVTSLYAVVFTDVDAQGTTDGTDEESDEDTFYACYEIDGISDEDELDESKSYTFTIEGIGSYQVCFVANPSTSLLSSIKGSSTVSDFKALTVSQDIDDPSTTPFVMTSTLFYSVTSPSSTTFSKPVTLQRLVARIDIINKAYSSDNIIISKAVLTYRATSSLLINDDASSTTSYISTTEKTYTLYDSNDTNSYIDESGYISKAEIYSYEQYDKDLRPTITLTYYHSNDESTQYTHTVDFVSDGNNIYLVRNTRYIIEVNFDNTNAKLRFSLSGSGTNGWDVADWNEGTTANVSEVTFNVGSTTIEHGVSTIDVGDFLMSDGTWKASEDMESYIASASDDDPYPIAIVYTVDQNRIGEYTKSALGGSATGLALALKNARESESFSVHYYKTNSSYDSTNDDSYQYEATTKTIFSDTFWCNNYTGNTIDFYNIDEENSYLSNTTSTYTNKLEGITAASTLAIAYTDYDGYHNTHVIWDNYSTTQAIFTDFPAFGFAKLYGEDSTNSVTTTRISTTKENTTQTGTDGERICKYTITYTETEVSLSATNTCVLDEGVTTITGWYLPSIGEWFDIIENLGGQSLDDYKFNTSSTIKIADIMETVAQNINTAMSPVGTGNYDPIIYEYSEGRNWFNTSSQYDADYCWRVDFRSTSSSAYLDLDGGITKQYSLKGGCVRCAIAFRLL